MINVILPCAGSGTRLGLPYPKEIHQIQRDVALIDLSFRLLLPHRELVNRVTITLTPQKTELVTYLAKWRATFPIVFTYFDEQYVEWPGSILSAAHVFGEKNVVLLPDSSLGEDERHPIIPTMDRLLDESDLVFGVLHEQGPRLKNLGAVFLETGGGILQFCDKPADDHHLYNGFWGTFGFSGVAGRRILELMTASVQRQSVTLQSLALRGVRGFPLQSYQDLGTWPALREMQQVMLESTDSVSRAVPA